MASSSALGAGLLKCLLSNDGVQPCTRDVIASIELLVASDSGRGSIAKSDVKGIDGVQIIFKLLKKVCPPCL